MPDLRCFSAAAAAVAFVEAQALRPSLLLGLPSQNYGTVEHLLLLSSCSTDSEAVENPVEFFPMKLWTSHMNHMTFLLILHLFVFLVFCG